MGKTERRIGQEGEREKEEGAVWREREGKYE